MKYTPIITNQVNLAAITVFPAFWSKVDDVITVSGGFSATPTGAGTTSFEMSLPAVSTFTLNYQGSGQAAALAVNESAIIYANAPAPTLLVSWQAGGGALRYWSFTAQYILA